MFNLTFLPARFGDCIWIEYGEPAAPRRVLIDGGTRGTRHDIRSFLAGGRHLDLLVISHVDRDHIEGILGLLEESDDSLSIGDVWFNGWCHLPGNTDEQFGPVQGERLSQIILDRGLAWNKWFDGNPIAIESHGPLPRLSIEGLEITLLSPTVDALRRLAPVWEREVREANLDPGFGLEPNDEAPVRDEGFGAEDVPDVESLASSEFQDDRSPANNSSIAFIAEFEGRRVLLAADAPAGVLETSLERFSADAPVPLDLFKVSHHGSRNTTSRSLVQKVRCPTFVFSTNGSIFKHPHAESVSRVIAGGGDSPELVFNYCSKHNEIWDLRSLQRAHSYRTRYPAPGAEGVTIRL